MTEKPLRGIPRKRDWTYMLGASLLLALCVFGIWATWEFWVDDAFITFRYSKHWAEGIGIRWNTKGHPVEGYTNFLWMALAALGVGLGLQPLVVARSLGVAALAGLTLILGRKGEVWSGSRGLFRLFMPAMLLVFGPTYFHAVSGMETTLYALLLYLLVEAVADVVISAQLKRPWLIPLLTLLAGATRPEGVLVGIVGIGAALVRLKDRERTRLLWAAMVVLVVPGAAYFAWRLSYFGYVFPNTFYVKVGHWHEGLLWTAGFVAFMGPLVLLVLASPVDEAMAAQMGVRMGLLSVAILPYAASSTTMDYAWRFGYHVFPIVVSLFGLVGASWSRVFSGPRAATLACACLALISVKGARLAGGDVKGGRLAAGDLAIGGYRQQEAYGALANALRRLDIPPEQRTIATGEAGVLPFLTDWHVIDYVGLNDEEISHGRAPEEVVLSQKPTLLLLYSDDGREPRAYQEGMNAKPLLRVYDYLSSVMVAPSYYLNVYLRSDLEESLGERLHAALQPVSAESRERNGPGLTWGRRLFGRAVGANGRSQDSTFPGIL